MSDSKNSKILNGLVKQKQKEYFTLRFQITAGQLTVTQLESIKQLASKFGKGEVHLTTRQGLEIPYLKLIEQEKIAQFLEKNSLKSGSTGPRLRNVNACPGNTSCRFGLINSPELAKQITVTFSSWELPAKLKVAVSGCPNSCAKPQVNDLGILGVVQPRLIRKNCTLCAACTKVCKVKAMTISENKLIYNSKKCVFCGSCIRSCPNEALIIKRAGLNLFVGGSVGRKPKLGHLFASFLGEDSALELIKNILQFYAENATPKERLGEFAKAVSYRFTPPKIL